MHGGTVRAIGYVPGTPFLALRECQVSSRAPTFLAALSRLQRITVDMGFDLTIAAKRDPTEGREPVFERGRSPTKTLTFHASGAFSHEDGVALASAIDDALAPDFCAYIVCLEAVDNVDESALLTFAQWIRGRRDEGLDLRLCAVEPHVHHLLEDVGEAGDALMPLAQATDTTPRRRVDTRLDAPKASS